MKKIFPLVLTLILVGCAQQPQQPQPAETEAGKALYADHGCAACHGLEGRGDGPVAGSLTSPPRDLTQPASYRQGASEVEIAETLRLGVVDTAMPPFPHIPEEDRVAIARYLVSLRDGGAASAPAGETEIESGSVYGMKELPVQEGLGGKFTLTDQNGAPYSLADGNGKIRLLFFGFTSCPDVCPMTLSKVTRVRRLLRDSADEVTTLLISVDPEVDTPEKLKEYLGYYDLGDGAVALTGTVEEVGGVVKLFHGYFEKEEAETMTGYVVNHTSYLYLIDRDGKVRALFQYTTSPEQIAAAIRALIMT